MVRQYRTKSHAAERKAPLQARLGFLALLWLAGCSVALAQGPDYEEPILPNFTVCRWVRGYEGLRAICVLPTGERLVICVPKEHSDLHPCYDRTPDGPQPFLYEAHRP
jgi:hypothetical protein